MSFIQPAPTDPLQHAWSIARRWIDDTVRQLGSPAEIARLLARAARNAVRRRLRALELMLLKLLLAEAGRLAAEDRRHLAGKATPMKAAPLTSVPANARAAAEVLPAVPGSRFASLGMTSRQSPVGEDPATWRVRLVLRLPRDPLRDPPRNSGPRITQLGPPLLLRDVWRERERRARWERMAAIRALTRLGEIDEAHVLSRSRKLARRFEALRRAFADPAPHVRRLKQKLLALKQRAFAAALRIVHAWPARREVHMICVAGADHLAAAGLHKAIAPPNSS